MFNVNYSDKVALVTGGGSGIGRAACLDYSKAGARVVCVDIDREHGNETVELVKKSGGEAVFFKADVTDASSVQKYVQDTLTIYGQVDAFANNAGFGGVIQQITEYPEKIFDRVMATNVKGVFLGLKYILPVMIKQKCGAIVNIGSVNSFIGALKTSAYVASKHAVMGLTRCAALEVAQEGIRVNAICPGITNTEMVRPIDESPGLDDSTVFMDTTPNGRRAEPEEVSRWIVYLTSDMASHITGQSLVIDGGLLAK